MADEVQRAHGPEPSWQQVAEGLLYTHARLSENTRATLEASSFLYGLIELLHERQLVSIDELDRRQREVAERLGRKNAEKRVGVLLQDPEYDKYTFTGGVQIDCASRVHLCKAACCRLPFALSKQDIHEGTVHWDLGQPYVIAQDERGYCTHLDRGCHRCTVHERRPVPCRAYDCRRDRRIWLDFESGTVNPDILSDGWPRTGPVGDTPAAGS
jgi:Fe-S-cluster containining protein